MRSLHVACLLLVPSVSLAQPGSPDPTFGTDGHILLGPGGEDGLPHDGANAIEVLADGRILVAGFSGSTDSMRAVLMRLLGDGTPDPAFGTEGSVSVMAGEVTEFKDMAVQEDGHIVLVGSTRNGSESGDLLLARVTPAGVLDETFGTGGIVLTSVSPGRDIGNAMLIGTDGDIMVCGATTDPNGVLNGLVVRFNNDGSLDTDFSGDGYTVITAFSGIDDLEDVALLPDGTVVTCGKQGPLGTSKTMLVKLDPNGALVSTFGVGGVLVPALAGPRDAALGLVADGDRILVCGQSGEDFQTTDAYIARFHADGTPDPTFNGTGYSLVNASSNCALDGIILQADGRILGCGVTGPEPLTDPCDAMLCRLLPDGTPDESFGSGGTVTTDLGPGCAHGYALALQSDGRILLAGFYVEEYMDILVARYLPDACAVFPAVTPEAVLLCPNGTGELTAGTFDTYQWYKNGVEIPGATGQTLIVTSADDVDFWFKVRTSIDTCFGFSDSVLVDTYAFLPPVIINAGDAPNLIGDNGEQVYCQGDDPILVLGSPYDTNVQWSLFGEPIAGANDTALAVSTSGNYTVQGAPSECPDLVQEAGVGIVIDFNPYVQPTIYASGILLCPEPEGLSAQWYYNGSPVAGLEQCVIPIDAGNYTVFVDYGDSCSVMSAPFNVVGLNELTRSDLKAFPVPTADRVTISWENGGPLPDWRVIDLTGRTVRSGSNSTSPLVIDLRSLEVGRYRFLSGDGRSLPLAVTH